MFDCLKVGQVDTSSEKEELLSLRTAVVDSARTAVPFALSRVAVAVQNFGNGIVISRLGVSEAIAAAPVMFMIQQGFIGAARGALSSVNTVIGDLNGQKKFAQIGPAVNQGLLLGTILGIPAAVIFATAPYWLHYFGMQPEIAEQAGKYLRALSYGILPTYWSVIDQQFLLSIKRNYSPIALNTLFVGLAMAIGFPLALLKIRLEWLGYGVSASAFATFAMSRYYLYAHSVDGVLDRNKYNLFSKSFDSGTSFKELFSLSFPTALQAISEWLPTTLVAILSAGGSNAQGTLEAEQPSMQMLMVMIQVLLGLGTAATVSVANALGSARAGAQSGDFEKEIVWRKNARTLGYGEVIVTALVTLPPAIFFMVYPDPVVKLFTNDTEVFPLSKSMLRLTGATLIADGIRNTTTGALLGKKQRVDNFFTAITNLVINSAIAVAIGYFTQNNFGPLSFFLFRMLGIVLSAAILLLRWEQTSKVVKSVGPFFASSVQGHSLSIRQPLLINEASGRESSPTELAVDYKGVV